MDKKEKYLDLAREILPCVLSNAMLSLLATFIIESRNDSRKFKKKYVFQIDDINGR